MPKRGLTEQQRKDLAEIEAKREKIRENIEIAERELADKPSVARRIELQRWRRGAQQALDDLDYTEDIVKGLGVPFRALGRPDDATANTPEKRRRDLRVQALGWRHEARKKQAEADAERHRQVLRDIADGKIDPNELNPLRPETEQEKWQREIRENNEKITDELPKNTKNRPAEALKRGFGQHPDVTQRYQAAKLLADQNREWRERVADANIPGVARTREQMKRHGPEE